MEAKYNTLTWGTARMRWFHKAKMFFIFLMATSLFVILTGSDYIWREDIMNGTDQSTYRCPNGLVSLGDISRDVVAKCGEPMRRTRMQFDPNSIWIYRSGNSQKIIYMGFTNDRLQRIHNARCWQDNPHCD